MSKYKSVILTLFVMLLWGSLFPMVKLGYRSYNIVSTGDILLFAGVRFTVCGILISLYALFRDKKSYIAAKSSMLPILLSGLFAIILHYGFTYTGLSLTESSKTAIIKQIGALLYVCFSFLFFREDRPSWQKFLGAALGFSGIIAINIGSGKISFNIGDLLIVLASFCTVFSNVISKKALKNVAPITMTGISQTFGGIVLLVIGLICGGRFSFNPEKWYVLAYICAASIVSYCVWFGIVKNAELSKLFIIKFSEPVFAAVFGMLILGEDIFKWQYLIAFLLISAGIAIANVSGAKAKK